MKIKKSKLYVFLLIVVFVLVCAIVPAATVIDNRDTITLDVSLNENIHCLVEQVECQGCLTEDVKHQINTIENDIRYDIERYHDHTVSMLSLFATLVTVLIALVGIVVPWLLTRRRENDVDEKLKEVSGKLIQTEESEKRINELKKTIDEDKNKISRQQAIIEGDRDYILKLKTTIQAYKEASEKAAKQAKVSELLSQAYHETDNKKSIEYLTQAILLDPKCAVAYYSRGVDKSNLGDNEGAIKDYDKAIELNQNEACFYNNRGADKFIVGDKEGALKDYSKAIDLDPEYASAYLCRGVVKYSLDDYEAAIKDYDKAIELNLHDAAVYSCKAWSLCDLKNYAAAFVNADISLQIKKTDTAYGVRGNAYMGLSKYNEALADFNKAIDMNPKCAEHYEHRAVLYRKMAEVEDDASKKEELIKKAEADEAKANELKK